MITRVICCRNGHKLRLPADQLGLLQVTCPRCRDSFEWSPPGTRPTVIRTKWRPTDRMLVTAGAIILVLFISGAWWAHEKSGSSAAAKMPSALPLLPVSNPIPTAPHQPEILPQSLPMDGETVRWFSGSPLPILTIITPNDRHRYIKIEDSATGHAVATVFIRSGSQYTLNLPAGVYRIKVAAGKTWYGTEHLFGRDTLCSVCDGQFEFTVRTETEREVFTSETITLIEQTNGNLETRPIRIEDF